MGLSTLKRDKSRAPRARRSRGCTHELLWLLIASLTTACAWEVGHATPCAPCQPVCRGESLEDGAHGVLALPFKPEIILRHCGVISVGTRGAGHVEVRARDVG